MHLPGARVGEQRHPRGTLPLELTGFVGREKELSEVEGLLEGARLLTLTGAGGSGKTRLALRLAAAVRSRFRNGAWWVELAPLSDPALVAKAAAQALSVHEVPGSSLTEVLVAHLEPKNALLVLDNCEHLIGACAALAETLLHACPELSVLATSREALGVAGEIAWLVPPLSLPDPRHPPHLETLAHYEAVRLFVERASAVVSTFELTEQNAPAIARVCHRLDGIPLAIELAAARAKVLSVEQIAGRLEDSFRLLTRGGRTAPPRHRTLRATMDWSHGLLSEDEQVLFRRLATFSGGFALGAAEEVCAGEGLERGDVLDLLSRLVDKSLVVVDQRSGEARYGLLETVRQYGEERLGESGEATAVAMRHASFFVCLAEEAEPDMLDPEKSFPEWVERLAQDHANLRAALGRLWEEGEVEQGLRLAGTLGHFWWFRGYLSEGKAQLEGLLELAGAAPVSRAARAKALHALGVLIYRSADYSAGDHEEARSHLVESVGIYRELGDWPRATAVLRELGHLSSEAGDWESAHSCLQESLELERQSGNEYGIALTRSYLGIMALLRGEHTSARVHLQESLEVLRRLGTPPEEKVCAFWRGLLACDEGDYPTACARLAEQVEDPDLLRVYRHAVPWVLQGYARMAIAEGQPARALRLAGAAAALHHVLGQSVGLACRDYFQHRLEPAWRALGEQQGKVAFEEGQVMTFEEALAYVLEEPPQEGTEDTSTGAQAAIGADPTELSARELEVLKLVAEGLTDSQAAQRLYLSHRTVGHHLRRAYRKLGVRSRTAAIREAAGRGLI